MRIFILPPSMPERAQRLHDRGTDSEEVIDFRMRRAAQEIGHWAEDDSVLIHDAVERYEFWKAGTEVVLTLSGPQGADNVDPWRIVTDSFGWQ